MDFHQKLYELAVADLCSENHSIERWIPKYGECSLEEMAALIGKSRAKARRDPSLVALVEPKDMPEVVKTELYYLYLKHLPVIVRLNESAG